MYTLSLSELIVPSGRRWTPASSGSDVNSASSSASAWQRKMAVLRLSLYTLVLSALAIALTTRSLPMEYVLAIDQLYRTHDL